MSVIVKGLGRLDIKMKRCFSNNNFIKSKNNSSQLWTYYLLKPETWVNGVFSDVRRENNISLLTFKTTQQLMRVTVFIAGRSSKFDASFSFIGAEVRILGAKRAILDTTLVPLLTWILSPCCVRAVFSKRVHKSLHCTVGWKPSVWERQLKSSMYLIFYSTIQSTLRDKLLIIKSSGSPLGVNLEFEWKQKFTRLQNVFLISKTLMKDSQKKIS